MRANVHEIRANLSHFSLVSKLWVLNNVPILRNSLRKYLNHLDFAILQDDVHLSISPDFRIPTQRIDLDLEVNVLDPLVLDEIVYADEVGVGHEE